MCQKTFKRKDFLKQHMRIHAPERDMCRCPREGCGRTYTTVFNLQSHILSFHEEWRPFVCEHASCGKTFAMKVSAPPGRRPWGLLGSREPGPRRQMGRLGGTRALHSCSSRSGSSPNSASRQIRPCQCCAQSLALSIARELARNAHPDPVNQKFGGWAQSFSNELSFVRKKVILT